MNRKRLVAALLTLTAIAALCAVGWRRSAQAEASTPLPTPSPSFSTIWMSVVSVEYDGSRTRIQAGTFLADQAGDVRVRASHGVVGDSFAISAYDNASRMLTRADSSRDGSLVYSSSPNVPPDYGMRESTVSAFEYVYSAAAIVRATQAEGDPAIAVNETIYLGRPAWQASYAERGSRRRITVDKATGFPLRYVLFSIQAPRTSRFVWRVVDIATDVPVSADDFTLDMPAGAAVNNYNQYEHFTTTDNIAAQVGYEPFLPDWLPDGTVLASASTEPDPWGPYGWIFPFSYPWIDLSTLPDNETHLYYHRGYDWFTVIESTRVGPGNSVPAQLDRQPRFAYRKTVLQGGAFAGKTARTWMGDGTTLYVQNGTYAVEITGDLTRSEILAVAASLQQ